MLIYSLMNMVATEGAVINSALITELLDLCKQVMGLFTEFPLNVFLISSLVDIGFAIFCKAKKSARSQLQGGQECPLLI